MRKKLSILIRTSGGLAPKKQLGFGHIFRTLNLAKNLKSYNVKFLLEDYGGGKEIFISKGLTNIKLLKKNISLHIDKQITISEIKKNHVDLLIIDRYQLKKEYVNSVSKIVKTIVISDLNNLNYQCELVVNGFIGFENSIIENKFKTKCLLGPKYQILDDNFSNLKKLPKKYTLLASFGGYDESGIIYILLKSLKNYISKMKVKIILGPGTKHDSTIKKFEKLYGTNLIISQKTDSMFSEISKSKYGLCSGGITSYEFAACKIPFGIISQVNHQLLTASEWQKSGIAVNLGRKNKKLELNLENFFENILANKLNTKNIKTIDGLGSKRISKIISNLFSENH